MALSPDGRQIYQAASDTLNVFDLEQVPEIGPASGVPGAGAPPPSSPPPSSPAVTPDPRRGTPPRIRSVKRGKRGRYRIRVQVFQAGKMSARFTGRLKRTAKVRTLGKPVSKRVTKPGTYSIGLKPFPKAGEHKVKAKLVVSIAPTGYLPARKTKGVSLR
jgi:hypothetical protein